MLKIKKTKKPVPLWPALFIPFLAYVVNPYLTAHGFILMFAVMLFVRSVNERKLGKGYWKKPKQ